MKKILVLLLVATNVFAASTTTKQIDNIQNSTGGSALAVPSAGAALVSDTSTVTMTNKTLTSPTINGGALSGTFTGAPTLSGALSLSGGPAISGAGSLTDAMNFVNAADSTKRLAFSLTGMTASRTLTLTSSQTTNQSLAIPDVGSGDSLATLNATQTFGVGSTWNGAAVGAAYGGTGRTTLTANNLLIGNGTGTVTLLAPSATVGYVLTSNGTGVDPSYQAVPSVAPTVNGTQASPLSVTAAGGVSLTTPTYSNVAFVVSNGGAVTVTATPSVTACTAAGQVLDVIGESNSNVITLQDEASLAGSKLYLNGNWTSALNRILTLVCDGNGFWVERSRQN